VPREFARQPEGGAQIVARGARGEEHDVAVLGDFLRQRIGEAAGVDDDVLHRLLALAQLFQALEGPGVDVGLDRVLQSQRVPFDAGELFEIEIGQQRPMPAMRGADREQPCERALADPALLADEADCQKRLFFFAHARDRRAVERLGKWAPQ
jgi:hypothetical protein